MHIYKRYSTLPMRCTDIALNKNVLWCLQKLYSALYMHCSALVLSQNGLWNLKSSVLPFPVISFAIKMGLHAFKSITYVFYELNWPCCQAKWVLMPLEALSFPFLALHWPCSQSKWLLKSIKALFCSIHPLHWPCFNQSGHGCLQKL